MAASRREQNTLEKKVWCAVLLEGYFLMEQRGGGGRGAVGKKAMAAKCASSSCRPGFRQEKQ